MKNYLKDCFTYINDSHDIKLEKPVEKPKEYANEKQEPADFEKAIEATGFGKFNYLLFLIAIPSGWASMFESTSVSFIIPVAQCDLNLSLEDKGYLIAVSYLGMLSSALVWGYLSDTLGRRKLLIIGYLLGGFFALLAGISQTFAMLLFSKYMGGFIINGPFAVLTTVLSEFHCAKYRARVVLCLGIVFSMASVVLPLCAWALLPEVINYRMIENFITLHSWNFFLIACALPSLVSALGHWLFLPESPKFLMSSGRNDEALRVFRKIYSMNTGKHPDTFPVKVLFDETTSKVHKSIPKSKLEAFKNGFGQLKPLFVFPHLKNLVLVCTLQLLSLMGLNTLRLWLPQLFTAISDYKVGHNDEDNDICVMLESLTPNISAIPDQSSAIIEECTVSVTSDSVYINLMVVSAMCLTGYLLVGCLINLIGKKYFYVTLGISAGLCGFGIYFAHTSLAVTLLSSLCIALSGISTNVLVTVVVDLFPTSLRTMAISISMMLGRFGAMFGNTIFPLLIQAGCLPPFIFIACAAMGCGLLALLLPKTDQKALE